MNPLLTLRVSAMAVMAGLALANSARGAEPADKRGPFRYAAVTADSLGLWEGNDPVLVYNHGPISRADVPRARPRACYIHPLYGLNGEVLTDDFPSDHIYHRGIYSAWPHIRIGSQEYDLWSDRGDLQQRFGKWTAQETMPGHARLGMENAWFVGDRQLVRENVELRVHAAQHDFRAIDVALTWVSLSEPITLWGAAGKSYGGFNFRFGPRSRTVVTVPENASLPAGTQATAGVLADDLLVTRLPWADFAGDFSGRESLSGAAVFVHPRHPDYPPTWMLRHYGLVSVGWPGVTPRTFAANEPITCRYRVWIHRGTVTAPRLQEQYERYVTEVKAAEAGEP